MLGTSLPLSYTSILTEILFTTTTCDSLAKASATGKQKNEIHVHFLSYLV